MGDFDDKHPRDDHGRFSSGLGAWASRRAEKFAGPIATKVVRDEGFTYRPGAPAKERTPKRGYMVSLAPDKSVGHVVEIRDMLNRDPRPTAAEVKAEVTKSVKSWLEKALPAMVKLGKEHYLGGYVQKDESTGEVVALHFDVSQHFGKRHKERAVSEGRARNQISIWDVKAGKEILTGGTGR